MPAEFQEGTYIDRYRVEKLLGAGAFSKVYRVFDEDLQRSLAVKVLHQWSAAAGDGIARFEREAKVLSQLLHQNIVRVYRFGFLENSEPFLVMELLEGESLRSVLEKRKRLPCHEAVNIAEQVCSALEFAHSLNVIHRDLKPENIVISEEPHGKAVKLLDFGLCKQVGKDEAAGSTLTETGFLVGTVNYMSPEQCMGAQVDTRSDVYSFGCVVYEMITGAPPFVDDTSGRVFLMHMSKPMPAILDLAPSSGLPQELEDLLLRCCRKNKDDRYSSFSEVRLALTSISQKNCSAVFDSSGAMDFRTKVRRMCRNLPGIPRRLLLSGAAVFLVLLGGAACFINFTDAGNLFWAQHVLSAMNPPEATAQLSRQLESLLRSGKKKTARELIESTTRNKIYELWPHRYRGRLFSRFIDLCKQSGMDEEAFSLSLALLQDLLECRIRSVELKTEPPDYDLLRRLSQEMAKANYSKKQWAQIYQTIEMKKNAFEHNPPQMVRAGYLRCQSGLNSQAVEIEKNPAVLARAYDSCLLMSLFSGESELSRKVAAEYSAFNLSHRLFTFETALHLEIGLACAQGGQMDRAGQELAVAERFAPDSPLSTQQEFYLQQLRQSCRQGAYVGRDFKAEQHKTNVKWILQYAR
jgi:hypothetical protein